MRADRDSTASPRQSTSASSRRPTWRRIICWSCSTRTRRRPADGDRATHTRRPNAVAHHLERELERTKAQLRDTVEQYEASTEELKASNEELQAMNEELRSATEELETSREELQSINEELTTVNQELKNKVDELGHANSDLHDPDGGDRDRDASFSIAICASCATRRPPSSCST